MRKNTVVALVVAVLFIIGASCAYAAGILELIGNQQRRIDHGIASGALTRHEADLLQDNLNWIKARFSRLKADGRLTRAERRELEAMLEENSRMIVNKKRNPVRKVYEEDLQERISTQQRRIDQGIMSGALTKREADVVQDNLNWIKNTHARMLADRRLTRKETRRLTEMLNDNSRMIQDIKHNPARRLY